MKVHVRQEFDPTILTNAGSLCGLGPQATLAGYNPAWDIVYRLDTSQAIRFQDVCPSCLRAIQAYRSSQGLPIGLTLP
jgi:hypothetical protein